MPAKINNLSIGLKVGSHNLILQTDAIPSTQEIQDAAAGYAAQLKEMMLNLSFKMDEGKVITVAVEDFFTAVADKIGEAGIEDLQNFFKEVAGATKGIYIDLWGLSFSTSKIVGDKSNNAAEGDKADKGKLSFAFNVRVNLTTEFYTNINVPAEITNLIAINSLGLGMRYDKDFAI